MGLAQACLMQADALSQARLAGETLYHFHGGLRLRHNKKISCETPVEKMPLATRYYVPLLQHTGREAEPLVTAGQNILKGEQLGCFRHLGSDCVHAPTSGTVTAIANHPISHPSGVEGRCVVIKPDGLDQWIDLDAIADWEQASPATLREKIGRSGIVGLGGAVFPTGFKVEQASERGIHTLILNGSECEPYISCDEMLMREQPDSIILGARILQKAIGASRTVIAIEDQMGVVNTALTEAVKNSGASGIDIVKVTTIYPEGGERQLIKVLTGLEVPSGGRPTDLGLLCQNVATANAVARAVVEGKPLIAPGAARLVLGGPMMGYALSSDSNPVIKAANCILLLTGDDIRPPQAEMPCIRCGECARVCPALLLPQALDWSVRNGLWDDARNLGLADCIECGCCDFVCPSHIPLVDWFRFGKSELRLLRLERNNAEDARQRFEARETRLERLKLERKQRIEEKKRALHSNSEKQKKIAVHHISHHIPPWRK